MSIQGIGNNSPLQKIVNQPIQKSIPAGSSQPSRGSDSVELTSASKLTNGSFQFSFTNTPGAAFGVLATTNIALPLTNWTRFSGLTESSPGQFQFTDSQPAADQRFYRVRSL